MKHQFLILPERRLIIESIATEMGLADYIAFKMELMEDAEFSPHYNVLTDLRDVKHGFSPEEVKGLATFFKNNMPIDVKRKGCMLTLKPLQTAYSIIFKKRNPQSAVCWEVCTTINEAITWLDNPMPAADLDEVLNKLKEIRRLDA